MLRIITLAVLPIILMAPFSVAYRTINSMRQLPDQRGLDAATMIGVGIILIVFLVGLTIKQMIADAIEKDISIQWVKLISAVMVTTILIELAVEWYIPTMLAGIGGCLALAVIHFAHARSTRALY